MGGHVARFLGDGVMAYFGWPTSREDDAERAVAAGLELIEAVSRLPTLDGESLAVRVGVATGLVAIGYGTEASDGGIAGETPNVAARLQAEAKPNTPGRGAPDGAPCRAVVPLQEPRQARHARPGRSAGSLRGQGYALLAQSLPGPARPLDGAAGRPQRRGRPAAQPMAAGGRFRRTGHPAVRRCRDRQVAHRANDARAHRLGDSRPALSMLAVAPGHGAVSGASATYPVDRSRRRAKHRGQDRQGAAIAAVGRASTPATIWPCSAISCRSGRRAIDCRMPRRNRSASARSPCCSRQFTNLTTAGPVLTIVEDVQWIDPTTEDLLVDIIGSIEGFAGNGAGDQPGRFLAALARRRLYHLPTSRAPERRRQPAADRCDRRRPADPGRPGRHRDARGGHPALPRGTDTGVARGRPFRSNWARCRPASTPCWRRGSRRWPMPSRCCRSAPCSAVSSRSPTCRRSRPAARPTCARWSTGQSGSGLLREAEPGNDSVLDLQACPRAGRGLCQPAQQREAAPARRRARSSRTQEPVGGRRWRGLARVPCRARRGLGQGRAIPHRLAVAGDSRLGQSRGNCPL